MLNPTSRSSPIPAPLTPHARLELAARLYRQFRARCFWHSPADLEITEDHIAFVAKGLQDHGGHEGFRLARLLQTTGAKARVSPGQDGKPCP